MEKEKWIKNVLNSTNVMKSVSPSEDLFSKIQKRIQQENKVSSKTLWLVAASIVVLVLLNFSVLTSKTKQRVNSTEAYLEMTVNKSNQLYQ
ncbi:MAG: hypothetical protein M0D53_15720 [Flavobacterium sp. JAD_PAG50586_2]|nr:MAG: hypothetical protein M0D53_15720 [Flavobacterium sp. JAD_PAG50586_2]